MFEVTVKWCSLLQHNRISSSLNAYYAEVGIIYKADSLELGFDLFFYFLHRNVDN